MNATLNRLGRIAVRMLQGGLLLFMILLVFAVVFVPDLTYSPAKARRVAAHHDVFQIAAALDLFHLDTGRYPTTEEGLAVLVTPTPQLSAEGKYRKAAYLGRMAMDPWGHPYHYRQPGQHNPQGYDLWSYGLDDAAGGKGEAADIDNWDKPPD